MDVEARAFHVPFSGKDLSRRFLSFLPGVVALVLGVPGSVTWAAVESSPMHWSGDRTLWDRKTNIVDLIGNAAVHQPGETITADRIVLNLDERTLDAVGNCIYVGDEATIHSDELHFNLENRTGTVVNGRVSSESFTLTGERINKLSDTRFQTHRGGYTTCRDCPQSWKLLGHDVDMEIEGYAFMSNVTVRVKDAPVFWSPYLIVPMKTKRQSGLLFPRFGSRNGGFEFILPFFWAINRSSDMTFALGEAGGRGLRGEWEGRYKLADRSEGTANLWYVRDRTFAPKTHRWGLSVTQRQELPFGIDEKLRLVETSDNLYAKTIGDVPGTQEAVLTSDLIFSHSNDHVSGYIAARRFRNLLNLDSPVDFDPKTVQVFPAAAVATNDRLWFGGLLASGLSVGITNFSRTAGAYDQDPLSGPEDPNRPFQPGKDPIRKGTRVSVTPSLYTTLRPAGGYFSLVPSLEYRAFFYSFHNEVKSLSRGYLLFRADLSTQIERIFDTSSVDVPKVKHLIRPFLTYNLIPLVNEPVPLEDGGLTGHPFLDQIRYAQDNNFTGYQFDNYDLVPLDNSKVASNYFVPLGHSVSYGFTSQLIRRKGALTMDYPSYQRSVELRGGQTFNFRELRKETDRQPLSRLFLGLQLAFDDWSSNTDYYYVPYIPITETQGRHILSTSFSYIFERSTHQRIFAFDRSFTVGYTYNTVGSRTSNLNLGVNYSITDYFLPTFSWSYDLVSNRSLLASLGLTFQSPSQCWRLAFGVTRRLIADRDPPIEYMPTIDFSLNLTGGGYGTISEFASTAASGGGVTPTGATK